MAASMGEIKQKKGGGGGMYVYKFDTGGSHQQEADQKKKSFHSGIMTWGLRRSKTVREVVNHHHSGVSKNPTECGYEEEEEEEKEVVEVAARKSACSEVAAGNRKSVSHLEVNVASVAAFLQVKILVTDMPGFMQVHAFRCARSTYDSLEKFSSKHMAYNIKKEFDKVYGPAWHCIVGSSFGSFVTHSTGCFLYFSMEKLYILVFKTKVQRSQHQS